MIEMKSARLVIIALIGISIFSIVFSPFTGGSCPSGQVVIVVTSSGVTCGIVTGDDLGNQQAAQNLSMGVRRIINLTDPTSSGDAVTMAFSISRYQNKLTQSCPVGQVISKVKNNGEVVCVAESAITPYCLRDGKKYSPGYKCIDSNTCNVNGTSPNPIKKCTSNGTWSSSTEIINRSSCPYYFSCGTTTTGSA